MTEFWRQPTLTMLDRADCLRLHRASCKILQQTGVRVFHDGGLKLLREAGAVISDDTLVKIPPSLVEWALASTPNAFTLYYRSTDTPAINLDGKGVYFGPGSDTFRYLDPRSGERRDFRIADIADISRLVDALPQINFMMSLGIPRDVPAEVYYRHQFATMIRHTTKPVVFVCDNLADIEAIAAMAAAVAGGMDKLAQYPNLLLYSEPTSPLQHSPEATDKLLFCAEHAIPLTHSPAPMMGGTAPVTIAGAVALGNAEILSSLVMHQLQKAGSPFLYGHGVHHLDMKEAISVYGAPEFQLARICAAEMGRFYHLPVWGYTGHSDSKVLDAQAAADAQFAVTVALLTKTNLNHDIGYLEAGLTGSPEMITFTDELIGMTRHFEQGIALDNESLALDVIDAVGPGGEYLTHDHTLTHWRKLWIPGLFNRQRLEKWEAQGSKDIRAAVKDRTVALMDSHHVEPLSDSINSDIDTILQRGA